MCAEMAGAAQRVLLIRAGALGDCLLMLPALTALRAHFPDACIEVMGYPSRWEWALGRGLVDAVHAIERPGMHLLFCRVAEYPESLRALIGGYDIILSYRPDPEGVFAGNLRALGARRVLSQSPFPPPPPPKIHVADFALRSVARLGVPLLEHVPQLPITPSDRALVQPFFGGHAVDPLTERLIVIHPGSGSAGKRWPLADFAALLATVTAHPRVRAVIVAGYAEEGVAEELLALIPQSKSLIAANWPLLPTAALIAHAAVFVGHDSGLTHLAAAFGRPTVALFGPTDPEIWGPRGTSVTVVRIRTGPTPEGDRSLGTVPSACAASERQRVVAAIERWLAHGES
jgi:ADP-heptose:LPS heptosyltransferase